jgi:hypothetical protein
MTVVIVGSQVPTLVAKDLLVRIHVAAPLALMDMPHLGHAVFARCTNSHESLSTQSLLEVLTVIDSVLSSVVCESVIASLTSEICSDTYTIRYILRADYK